METCRYGSGASKRKPTAVKRKGVVYQAYKSSTKRKMPSALSIWSLSISEPIIAYGNIAWRFWCEHPATESSVASYIRPCWKGIGVRAEDGYHYRRPIMVISLVLFDSGLYGVPQKVRAIVRAKIKKGHRPSEIHRIRHNRLQNRRSHAGFPFHWISRMPWRAAGQWHSWKPYDRKDSLMQNIVRRIDATQHW